MRKEPDGPKSANKTITNRHGNKEDAETAIFTPPGKPDKNSAEDMIPGQKGVPIGSPDRILPHYKRPSIDREDTAEAKKDRRAINDAIEKKKDKDEKDKKDDKKDDKKGDKKDDKKA